MGYAAKDMVKTAEGGMAEIRVLTKLFPNKINYSYWLDVRPPTTHHDKEEAKKSIKEKWPMNNNCQNTENYALKLKVNRKVKESKSITPCSNLMSLYRVTDQTEGTEDDNCITIKSSRDVFVMCVESY